MQTRGGNIENHLTVAFNTCNLEFFCCSLSFVRKKFNNRLKFNNKAKTINKQHDIRSKP